MNLEQEILKSISKGNKKSFEILFKTYYKRLCAYAVSFVSRNDIAEDIVTDVLFNLWNKRQDIKIKGPVSHYLFKSVKNSCINFLNREKYNKFIVSENEVNLLDLNIKYNLSDNYPLYDLIGKELEKKIKMEIENLPQQCREIFYQSRFEYLSHKEIARKLNISEKTVKVQVYRALTKLRKGLKDYLPTLILFFSDFF